ncbi:hypothetical protein FKP32DRAFT_1680151 [Trametes sanguinea]|nr:hypothetical protein FKP32DRAFT_1680151 [Trametes sanguinea]
MYLASSSMLGELNSTSPLKMHTPEECHPCSLSVTDLQTTTQLCSPAALDFEPSAMNVTVRVSRARLSGSGYSCSSPAYAILSASPLDPRKSSECATGSEESQTVQQLVLRKRTTSPYQIKLPYMSDRLRARRIASADASKPTLVRPFTAAGEVVEPTTAPVTIQPSLSCLPPLSVPTVLLSDGISTQCVYGHDDALHASMTTIGLSSLDTWSEICEDLSRAMEVFAVLSDVAPPQYFALEASPLDAPSRSAHSVSQLPGLLHVPSSLEPTSPWMNMSGTWSSFVFPSAVA